MMITTTKKDLKREVFETEVEPLTQALSSHLDNAGIIKSPLSLSIVGPFVILGGFLGNTAKVLVPEGVVSLVGAISGVKQVGQYICLLRR